MAEKSVSLTTFPTKEKSKVLIIADQSDLARPLVQALEEKGCQVFSPQKLTFPEVKIDYIFQLGKFGKTKKILERAAQDKARYLLVEDLALISDQQRAMAEESVFAFQDKLDGRLLRIERVSFSKTSAIVDQILKAMFGQKKPLPSRFRQKTDNKKQITKNKIKKVSKLEINRLGFWLAPFLLTIILVSPFLGIGVDFWLGIKNLQSFKENYLQVKFKSAYQNAQQAEKHFHQAEKISSFLPFSKKSQRLSFLGQTLSQTAKAGVEAGQTGQRILKIILEEEEGNVKNELNQFEIEIEDFQRQISLAQAVWEDLNLESSQLVGLFSLGKEIEKIDSLLVLAKELCLLSKKALPLTRSVLAPDAEKTYLLLFLNNMELRPGGGFIGSYGLVNFKNGVMEKLETYDVYTADGQLKGHVEPPAPIRKYLGQSHFFLRDSNFSPDFAVNAQKAAWFLKKEIGQEVDGVIAIDPSFVQALLEEMGEIYLPDYQEKITAENLFLKAQNLIQSGFFPGSTQKRDFLGGLSRAIFNQIKIGGLSWFKIGKSLKSGLEEKHIQVFLVDEHGQRLVEELGWSGRTTPVSCPDALIEDARLKRRHRVSRVACFPDYLMLVEANLGVNKANYFVKREISLETNFADKELEHHLSIVYQNQSPGKTFPGGVYKNYLRVFGPQKAVLKTVAFDGQERPVDSITTEEEKDKQSWGVLLEIDPGEKRRVEFEYILRTEEFVDQQFAYQLFFQKQAGTDRDPLFLKFNYPKTWQIKKTNFSPLFQNGTFSYNSDLSVDRIFSIEFSVDKRESFNLQLKQ